MATVVQIEIAALRRDLAAKQLAGDRALALIVERMLNLTGASGAAVALARETEMVCRASAGDAPSVGACIDPNSGLSFECLRTARLVRCDDTETDSRADRSVCRSLQLRSIMIVPIMRQGRAEGVLEVFSPRPYAFESGDELILDQLADLVAEIALGKATGATGQDHIAVKPAEQEAAASPAIARQSSGKPVAPQSLPPAVKIVPQAAPASPAGPLAWLSTAKIVSSAAAGLREQLFSSRTRTAGAGVLLVVLSLGAWQGLRSKTPTGNQGPQLTPLAAAAVAPAVSEPPPVVVRESLKVKPIVIADRPAKKPPTPITLRSPEVAAAPSPIMAFARPAEEGSSISNLLSAPVATPQLDPASISHVSGGKLLTKVAPVYPRSLAQGMQGQVVLKATVNRKGQVSKVSLVRGPAVLAHAAIAAILRWRYEPFLLDGAPVEVENEIVVDFTLPGQ